ncbi:PPi-type phosphoenolpyruvate carboxykinase [Aduncisulcus paluster]|uniref:PPi-type phosphoenolpyruvate carboxykinase n=1 Tax=Aduncisulcus paluster TaxID=2918883 RepID=A0ABQ5K570_9EUKA|nr:PPi-type phosphoenolpyruvate carboxykinase [Aduncisulcus paluster]|eukprot:gnl/Carplike_NY0171/456_a634_2291.p1 GENE.gnl/Carplike_NY0171/456_a634_2291~~gnl/Carplike_NY0171/456_a634_2291.p1  ORF type:complete len:1213 (+),score=397.47 gnl/Carplike_NY0171/456_a634_2291:29-3667(+)
MSHEAYADSMLFSSHSDEVDKELSKKIGLMSSDERKEEAAITRDYINVKILSHGYSIPGETDKHVVQVAQGLVQHYRATNIVLSQYLPPCDARIQRFVEKYLDDVQDSLIEMPHLPKNSFTLDRSGIARTLSIPFDKDSIESTYMSSYRLKPQGVLHNPQNDRRTTQNVFHVAEGGLPIPDDKISVPKHVFGNLMYKALHPPEDDLILPYTASLPKDDQVKTWVSLLLRPLVVPGVPGKFGEKRMETRVFVPGSLVAITDFVESIFGNAGDPWLPENDAGLDPHWSQSSGLIIISPSLRTATKKELGLPSWAEATQKQRDTKMCYQTDDEPYHNGKPFKIVARTAEGVIISIIADSYFGYAKKSVKTQLSYASNMFGLSEEEHSGGALAAAAYNWGDHFKADSRVGKGRKVAHWMENATKYQSFMKPNYDHGYAIDKNFPNLIYVPESTEISLPNRTVTFDNPAHIGKTVTLPLQYGKIYILPNGYRVFLEHNKKTKVWYLVGVNAEPVFCHKPTTVSGAGKSEISKSLNDVIVSMPIYVSDFDKDFDAVDALLTRDYRDRWLPEFRPDEYKDPEYRCRPILSTRRSLGSVIKLLSPSVTEYTKEYNEFCQKINPSTRCLLYLLKAIYKPEWGDDWRHRFKVDVVNGAPGHELIYVRETEFRKNQMVRANYLRVGTEKSCWRTFKLRQDFHPSFKVQMEDDISSSIIAPGHWHEEEEYKHEVAVKHVSNAEHRFFQRPDECIVPGHDKQAERDLARMDGALFCSNYEKQGAEDALATADDVMELDQYSGPVKDLIAEQAKRAEEGKRCISYIMSSKPRIVDGKPTKNVRYLQDRPTYLDKLPRYIAEVALRLHRGTPQCKPVPMPVSLVLPGRRLNVASIDVATGKKIRTLAVFNPIHYQELPELLMDVIPCITGKSPSTTGAGTEGALTKNPFNAISGAVDLNNFFVGLVLTGNPVFSTAAGFIGQECKVDHDISLMIPELFSRLRPDECDPTTLIEEGMLEKVEDIVDEKTGEVIEASRLGFRITLKFVTRFFGRMFDNPFDVFTEKYLRPELQDLEEYKDGVKNIIEAQKKVADGYIRDGGVHYLVPPLQCLIYIMSEGSYHGVTIRDPRLRAMFTRENVMKSSWYKDRLVHFRKKQLQRVDKHIQYMEQWLSRDENKSAAARRKMGIVEKLEEAKEEKAFIENESAFLKFFWGSIGADLVSKHPAPKF